ncbi:acyl-CoA dehydrogenase [Kitasatospora sp. NPDC048286]|uniref:acyl-CoA dehydrogenase n=1 Tax=Kitasatospora sp. NPDC048286 TaxID=3364047 RepID=UPI00371BA996
MRFLERERAAVAKLLPDLDETLRTVPLMELEGTNSPGIRLFRESGGAALMAPTSQQGRGATALDALRVQRALGARMPSVASATAAHHFSLAVLLALASVGDSMLPQLVEGVVTSDRLMAFAFAEERSGAGILSPAVTAAAESDLVRVSGAARPGGLASSMDLLMATVTVPRSDGKGEETAVALLPAESEGLSVGGADNERVTLDGVGVPPELLVRSSALDGHLEAALTTGLAQYQLLTTAGCLGAASALVEQVLLDTRVPESERVRLLVETEAAMAAAEGVARRIDDGAAETSILADALFTRYSVQDTLYRVIPRATELLADLGSVGADEIGHLAGRATDLALRPPARPRTTGPLAAYLAGGPLTVV